MREATKAIIAASMYFIAGLLCFSMGHWIVGLILMVIAAVTIETVES